MPFRVSLPLRFRAALLALLALPACVPAPKPAPAPVHSAPAAPAVAAPAPAPANWMDAAPTPGDWSWRSAAGASTASFRNPAGQVLAALRCDRAAKAVELLRAGRAGDTRLTVRSEAETRALAGTASADGAWTVARIAASDRLLDAIAFSRGRFAVEASGLPTLYLPAYPELTRVVEDCR